MLSWTSVAPVAAVVVLALAWSRTLPPLVVAVITLFLARLWSRGQLEGFVEFYTRMSVMSVSSSIPAAVNDWYRLAWLPNNIMTLQIMVAAALGVAVFVAVASGARVGRACSLGDRLASRGFLSVALSACSPLAGAGFVRELAGPTTVGLAG